MKKVTIKYYHGSYTLEELMNESVIIDEIKIANKKVKQVNLQGQVFKVQQQTTVSNLKDSGDNVRLQDITDEVNGEEEEELGEYQADIDYAYGKLAGNHDCQSFDEYMDQTNNP